MNINFNLRTHKTCSSTYQTLETSQTLINSKKTEHAHKILNKNKKKCAKRWVKLDMLTKSSIISRIILTFNCMKKGKVNTTNPTN